MPENTTSSKKPISGTGKITKMKIHLRAVKESDRDAVISIFNYYVIHGYAAYPDQPVSDTFFAYLRHGTFSFYVIESAAGVVGFGFTKPFLPFPVFSTTFSLTYFIMPEYSHHGLGTRLLHRLLSDAKDLGLNMAVANMSSRNDASVQFHTKHGFEEAGRLHRVGIKFGEPFDVIWMQKAI